MTMAAIFDNLVTIYFGSHPNIFLQSHSFLFVVNILRNRIAFRIIGRTGETSREMNILL